MKKFSAFLLLFSILLNLFLGWVVYTKHPLSQNNKVDYETTVSSIKKASRYLEDSTNEKDIKLQTKDLFQSLEMIDTALIFLGRFSDTFNSNYIDTSTLQVLLENMRYDLTISVSYSIIGKDLSDNEKTTFGEVRKSLKAMSLLLPDRYNYAEVKKAMSSLTRY
jgi:hypothetical protein